MVMVASPTCVILTSLWLVTNAAAAAHGSFKVRVNDKIGAPSESQRVS